MKSIAALKTALLGSILLWGVRAVLGQEAGISVHAGEMISHVSPDMSGIVLEDCNHELYGGLYSQMIFGESFQEPPTSIVDGFTAIGGTWLATDGQMRCDTDVFAKLIARLPPFADGEVGVEIRSPEKGRNVTAGLLFRTTNAGLGWQNMTGYEATINGQASTVRLSRYDKVQEFSQDARPLPSTDDWVPLIVKMHGGVIEVLVNGATVLKTEDAAHPLPAGSIGLVQYSGGALFRNLWVKIGDKVTPIPFEPNGGAAADAVSHQWQVIRRGDVTGLASIETQQPLFPTQGTRQSQRLTYTAGTGAIGIENRGLNRWGMNFQAGKPYEGCIRVRAEKSGNIYLAMESGDGSRTFAQEAVRVTGAGWQTIQYSLTPNATDPAGRFAIELKEPGSVVIGYAFLQPGDWGRFKGLPVRGDIGGAFADRAFNVARFGGGMVNGGFRWKLMRGPRDRRPPYFGSYYRYSTNGWGALDFLNLCEAANIMAIPDFDIGETPQDMADFVEYANGSASTEWGRLRAEDGHPAPYNVKHIEIGNEARINEDFARRFNEIAEAIWRKDPGMILVVGDLEYPNVITDPYHLKAPLINTLAGHKMILDQARKFDAEVWVDVHVGTGDPYWKEGLRGVPSFISALDRISPDSKHKVCIFELNSYRHDYGRGLSNARCINALERLGDKIPVATAATGLEAYGHVQQCWDEGMIFFSQTKVWRQPAYYVAQMITRNYLPLCVKADVTCANDALGVTVKRSQDGKIVQLQVVNSSDQPLPTPIAFDGFTPRGASARVTELCGRFTDENTPQETGRIKSVERDWSYQLKDNGVTYTFPERSFTVLRFE